MQESKELTKGKVSIGAPTFIGKYFLNKYIKDFMLKHPSIIIKIANHNCKELLELIKQHSLDILVVPGNVIVPKELKSITLEEKKFCFAYNKNKFLINEINSIEDIVSYPLLLPVKTSEQRKELEVIFNEKEINVDPIMELGSNELMLNYIKEGIGIGYILTDIAKSDEELQIIELNNLPSEKITLIYNEATLTISSKEFINMLANK